MNEEEQQIACKNCEEPKFFAYLQGAVIILSCPGCGKKMGLPIAIQESEEEQEQVQQAQEPVEPIREPELVQEPEKELEELPKGPKQKTAIEKYLEENKIEEDLDRGIDEEMPKEMKGEPEEADSSSSFKVAKQDFTKAVNRMQGKEEQEEEIEPEPEKPKPKFKKMQNGWRDKLRSLIDKEDDENEGNNSEDE